MRLVRVIVGLPLLIVGCGGDSASPITPTTVVPNYQGAWTGSWTSQKCSESASSGSVVRVCLSASPSSSLRVTLAQTATAVQGTIELDGFLASVSGAVAAHGGLSLAGQGRQGSRTITVSSWQSVLTGNVMGGSFIYTIDPDPFTGRAETFQGSFPGLTR